MNKMITLGIVSFLLIIPSFGNAVVIHEKISTPNNISINNLKIEDWITLDRKEVEDKIGRRLKLKEKITLRLIKAKTKKLRNLSHSQSKQSTKTDGFAITGLLGSLAGFAGLIFFSGSWAIITGLVLGIFALTFSIIALKRIKQKPESRKGKALAIVGLFLGSTLLLISTLGGIGFLM